MYHLVSHQRIDSRDRCHVSSFGITKMLPILCIFVFIESDNLRVIVWISHFVLYQLDSLWSNMASHMIKGTPPAMPHEDTYTY